MHTTDIRNILADAIGGEQRLVELFNARSFTPEKRAEQALSAAAVYAYGQIKAIKDNLEKEGFPSEIDEAEFVERFARKWADWQLAEGRTASAFIVGPSKFPTHSNRKRQETANRRYREFEEWARSAPARYVKHARLAKQKELGPQGVKAQEIADLEKRLADREAWQDAMKKINKIIRGNSIKPGEHRRLVELAKIEGVTLPMKIAQDITAGDWRGMGFQRFALSNNSAEIRRLKKRLEVERKKLDMAKTGKNNTITIGDVVMVQNWEEDRVQVRFPGKPDAETRALLKSFGFRWAPSQGAWQRKNTKAAVSAAQALAKELRKKEGAA